jgi:uncharacterized protein YegJ (DUF2314 family)
MRGIKAVLYIIALANAIFLLASCSRNANSDDPVTAVDSNDKEMNGAIDHAKETVQRFITALQSPAATQSSFSVKKKFTQGEKVEYFWLTDVTFDGQNFHGKVDNDAEMVTNVKIGDDASVGKNEISDWMFIENGKLAGGYTLRVLYSRMPQKEKEDFLKNVPFKEFE